MRYLAAIALCLCLPVAGWGQVRVCEADVVLPTYPIGPDDVNPHFYESEGSVIVMAEVSKSAANPRIAPG